MTLNQILYRIKAAVLAHKQVRNFYYGNVSERITDRTTRYPSCFVLDNAGSLDVRGKQRTLNFQIYLLDLVHVSEDTKENEQDIQSDMLSICEDVLTILDFDANSDMKVNGSASVTLIRNESADVLAGAMITVGITTIWEPDMCAVPTDTPIIEEDMKETWSEQYTADGTEGTTLSIPVIVGKKILLVNREPYIVYRVSVGSDEHPVILPTEYGWDDTQLYFGSEILAGERFTIMYRNY